MRMTFWFMFRQLLPGYKSIKNKPNFFYKQVCIYGFNNQDLQKYLSFGRKSILESIEDIEILRFLEFDKKILMFECKNNSHAVDVPEDVKKIEKLLKKEMKIFEYSSLIFDCDGVILNSNQIKTEAFKQIFEPFGLKASNEMIDFHIKWRNI